MSKDRDFYTLNFLDTGYAKYFDLCGFAGFFMPGPADCVSIHKVLSVEIMIAFDLRCDQDHTFEAWFQDGQAYETQREKGLLTCPVCGSNRVKKIPSAVAVCKRYMGKDGCTSEAVLSEVLNNLYTIKNNRYLRIVSTIASFFLFIMALGTVFKFQHWPGAGIMIQISLLPSIIFTMIVLVTLPGSSYIQWEKKHKILFSKKLLIPWIFFMLFTASVLLLPRNITRQLFSADSDAKAPFAMKTYDIEQKDGLEQPDQ